MNKIRRQKIQKIATEISNNIEALRDLFDEETECLENMEEHFSGTERYSEMEDALGEFEDILDTMTDAMERMDDL